MNGVWKHSRPVDENGKPISRSKWRNVPVLVVAPLVLTAGVTTASAAAATNGSAGSAPVVQLGTATTKVTDDTYTDPGRKTAIWGAAPSMTAKPAGDKISFVRFAVSNIPAGAEVTSARLHVDRADTHHLTGAIASSASTNWSENTATYANAPAVGAQLDQKPTGDGGLSVNLNVAQTVTGNGVVAFALQTKGANTWGRLRTKESGHPATLTVTWRKSAAVSTPAPAPKPVPTTAAPAPKPTTPAPKPTTAAPKPTTPAPKPTTAAPKPVTPPAPKPQPTSVSWTKTLFGSDVSMNSGESRAQAYERLKTENGRMDLVRVYTSGVPTSWSSLQKTYGNAPMNISFKLAPRDVIAGKYDSAMTAWFASAPTNRPTWWTYYHEPEDNIAAGEFTASDYRAAWQHLSALASKAKNQQMHATLVLMAWSVDAGSHRNWRDYYPGEGAVDTIAWDSYNNAATSAKGRYKDPSELFDRAIAATKSVNKTFAIAEFGSALAKGDDGSGRASWLRSIGSYAVSHNASFIALFDSGVGGDYRIVDAKSRAGWRQATLEH